MPQHETDWTATLTLREHPREQGGRKYQMAVNLPLNVMNGRVIRDLRMNIDLGAHLAPTPTLKEFTEMLHQKVLRREQFLHLMRQLGGQMADHLEDAEGWHGKKEF